MTNDQQLLAELQKLARTIANSEWTETTAALVLPMGTTTGYAFDNAGHIVGIKVAGVSATPEVLSKILQFKYLERLVFYSNEPFDLPVEIQNLKNLSLLWLGGTFRKLPQELLGLGLPIIVTDSAGLISLQTVLSNETFHELQMLDRPGRDIDRVESENVMASSLNPRVIAELSELRGIFLALDAVEDPPLEIAKRGQKAIERYFLERSAGALPLNELKVLLVGNGAAGKTSLVKRMIGDAFDAEEPQTHGIRIRSWSVRTHEDKVVKLNFWDFGGQEIMHATHQFFLSKRSMYILVLDGRKEEDPEYWLQHIESFGGDSPILIVLNKIDEHPAFEVNRRFLKSKYKGILDFFRVSCATGYGVPEVTERLREELTGVSMLQTLWPKDWFNVKQRLENLETSYVSLSQYRAICEEENVLDRNNQEILVDFLNDLGVILHFRDIKLLDTHVLDPRWVTEAVYRIINSELLARQKGFLALSQLASALEPRAKEVLLYPSDKHRYIVDLMLKFELCYELDNNALLLPDLLDIQEPAIAFNYDEALRFVFEYTYLPKSIMARFIVRMNKDIKDSMRWRTGVLLEDKSFGATALVLADEKDKKIYTFVNGKQKRDYFSVIRKVVNDINSSFEKLGVTELVPLPDVPDVLLDYRELIGYELAERYEIFVGRLGRAYNVETLLNGLEKKTARQNQLKSVMVVHGDYVAQSKVAVGDRFIAKQQTINVGANMNYSPHSWEKIIVYITGFLFLGVVSFLLIRNERIADPNLVVLVRTVLSIVVATFGATVPGMLKVDFSAKGLSIRAIGALALFVITFLLTPKVL